MHDATRIAGGGHAVGDSCRPDQLFGFWACEEQALRRYHALAVTADLEKLRAESRAAAKEAADAPPYRLTPDGIAIVSIAGPMTKYPTSFQALFGGTSTIRTREALRAAVRDPDVTGIMLTIDSPGGTSAGLAELATDIRKAGQAKPLHTYADDAALSAGLLALTQGRQVWASGNASIGSLGVFMRVEDTSQRYLQDGVKVHVISSAPPIKGAGEEGTEITPDQLAEWKRRVDELSDWFQAQVSEGRGKRLARDQVAKLATGQSWIAEKARELGLIDGVLSFDEALARLRSEVMAEQETAAALAMAAEQEKKAADALAQATAAEAAASAAQAENKVLKERLAVLEADKRKGRFAAEAKTIGAPEAFAEVLDQIQARVGDELYGNLFIRLTAMHEQIDEGKLFGELGTTGATAAEAATAYGEMRAKAQQLLDQGKVKTLEQGIAAVMSSDPSLYARHVAEQKEKGK